MVDEYIHAIQAIDSVLFALGISFIVAILVYIISPLLFRKVLQYISTENLDFEKNTFIRNFRSALSFTPIVLGLSLTEEEFNLTFSVESLLLSALLTVLAFLWLRVANNIGKYVIYKMVKKRYDESIIPIVENIWTLLIILVAVFSVFEVWGIDITPLLASAGVAGIVLGLAARETISNFFGSIALYADDAYEKGDYIEIENGSFSGFVHDISIRSTQIVTLDGNKVVVPNSKLHNSIIENKSTPQPKHRIKIDVGTSFDTPPRKTKKAIDKAVTKVFDKINNNQQFDKPVEQSHQIFLKQFDDSAMIFTVMLKIKSPQQEFEIKSTFLETVYEELEEQNINIPYPQRTIHMQDDHNKTEE